MELRIESSEYMKFVYLYFCLFRHLLLLVFEY